MWCAIQPGLIQVLHIYLVEDSPVIRENLIATLEELLPVEVVGTAVDEASAVRWLNHPDRPVDLVIVDIFLRGGSGLGVLRAAQVLPQRHRLVVLSNCATPAMRRNCLAMGAERVFDKSNEIEQLIAYCAAVEGGCCPDIGPVALA
jgi:DNA-binding NarL/FixJ family response regulator